MLSASADLLARQKLWDRHIHLSTPFPADTEPKGSVSDATGVKKGSQQLFGDGAVGGVCGKHARREGKGINLRSPFTLSPLTRSDRTVNTLHPIV